MSKIKKLDSAIKKGSFMIFSDDWGVIKNFNPASVGAAMIKACEDSWSEDVQRELGNGFLYVPTMHLKEVAAENDVEKTAAYSILMKSNIAARKTYIKNNPLLKNALDKVRSVDSNSDDCESEDIPF